MFESRKMQEGFKPVVGGHSSNPKQGEHHWCGWVDLNTNALIASFTKQDDSTQPVHRGRQGLVLATCFSPHPWIRQVLEFNTLQTQKIKSCGFIHTSFSVLPTLKGVP